MTDTVSRLSTALAGHYRIERELGQGGMATVYLAEDLKHERKVAVKVLRPDLSASLGSERFLREIRIAAQLQHPHVLTVFDSGEAGGFLYYVMPYIEGETLRAKLVRDGQLPVGDAVRILREIADALAYAHGRGVVHRDMKPENVMLSGRHASVMDFGVAKAVNEATGRQNLTTIGVAIGTPTYMAPEQATADPNTDHRADIYAVGVIAYELLTGRPPFSGITPQAVLAAHVTQAPAPVSHGRATVPPALAELVMRCLEKNPADRPQRASELFDRFDQLATTSGSITPTETAPHPAVAPGIGVPPARRRLWIGLAAAAIVLLACYAAWRWRQAAGAADEPIRLAVLPFENLGPPGQAYFADGLVDEVRGHLTGLSSLRVIARTSSEGYRGKRLRPEDVGKELGVQYILTGTVRWQDGASGAAAKVRVSPELIRTDDGTTAWEQSFDAEPTDAFAVQSRIAGEVTRALHVALTPQEEANAGAGATRNAAAYDAYLQGEALFRKAEITNEGWLSAVAALERAVTLDPGFALGWAALAHVQVMMYWQVEGRPEARLVQATTSAARAIALSPALPESHLANGLIKYWGHLDYAGGRLDMEQALRTRPNDVTLLLPLSYVARRSGQWAEAEVIGRRIVELDPRNAIATSDYAYTVARLNGPAAADSWYERAATLAPEGSEMWYEWMDVRVLEGKEERIREVLRRAEATKAGGFASWFLVQDFENNPSVLVQLMDPLTRSRLLGASITSIVPADSAQMLLTKSILASAGGDAATSRRLAEAARSVYARLQRGDRSYYRWPLGVASALLRLNRPDDAVTEARRAATLLPPSRDDIDGPRTVFGLAAAHAMAGHADSAFTHLQTLAPLRVLQAGGAIELAPEFASLRDDPRFKDLMKKARRDQ